VLGAASPTRFFMRLKLRLSLLLLCALCTAGVGTGCFGVSPIPSATPYASQLIKLNGGSERPPLPIPTKDEVALVDGRALSITAFLTLRSHLRTHATEAIFWVGTAALALQNETRARGEEIQISTAVDIARYALGELNAAEADTSLRQYFARTGLPPTPANARTELDHLLSKSSVQRNERAMSSLGKLD